ncbi:hypothetical protein Tco_0932084 [Tanacetum coccineum]
MKHGNVLTDSFVQCLSSCFSKTTPTDTFYKFYEFQDQDALDSAAGGNFLDKMPQEGLAIIESKSKVRYSRSRASDSRMSTNAPLSNSSPSNNSFDMQQIAASLEDKMTIKMKQMMNEMKALVVTTPAPVKAVEEDCFKKIHAKLFQNPVFRNSMIVQSSNVNTLLKDRRIKDVKIKSVHLPSHLYSPEEKCFRFSPGIGSLPSSVPPLKFSQVAILLPLFVPERWYVHGDADVFLVWSFGGE